MVESEGESTVASTALAGEIMRRMSLTSVIVVSDGYHVYRVKKMLEFRGLKVYGSPRRENPHDNLREGWNYSGKPSVIFYGLRRAGVRRCRMQITNEERAHAIQLLQDLTNGIPRASPPG